MRKSEFESADKLISDLKKMEKYLRNICKGYERKKWKLVGTGPDLIELDPSTHAFIRKSEVSAPDVLDPDQEFFEPASAVRDEIRRLIARL